MREDDFLAAYGFHPQWTDDEAALRVSIDDGSFFCWAAWKKIQEYKMAFEKDDGRALLESIYLCARYGLPMPEWVAENYRKDWRRYVTHKVTTLDEAFNIKRPKGYRRKTEEKNTSLAPLIPHVVEKRRKGGQSIGKSLFEEVGKTFNGYSISASDAEKIYYANINKGIIETASPKKRGRRPKIKAKSG